MATITVKPYVDKTVIDGVGLVGLGISSFPKTKKSFQVPIKNGRYLTGFDEKASYLFSLDEKEKAKEIKKIKEKCKELDNLYPHMKICDCSTENELYSKMIIELGAENNYFDSKNILDEIKISIIRTGAKYSGDSYVAASFEEADNSNKDYFYFLSDPELDIVSEVKSKKKRNNAFNALSNIEDNISDLKLYTKYLLRPSKGLNTLSSDGLYNKLDDFINGIVDGETSKNFKENYDVFTKTLKMDKTEILTKVVIKYGLYLNIIRQRADKEHVFVKTGNELGKTPNEVYDFLTNIKNLEIYEQIKQEVNMEVPLM